MIRMLYCLAAGACDVSTGILLLASPLVTLRLMRVPVGPTEPIYLRFIGAFVLGVGLVYLLPLCSRAVDAPAALNSSLRATALVRASVGLFVAASVAAGALSPAWSIVAVTDLGLAGVQALLLYRGGAA